MTTERNAQNDRLTIRLDATTKAEMTEYAEKNDVSLAWIVRRSWVEFKDAVKKNKIKL